MELNISIGILAYNESALINKTLKSLFHQSLFNAPNVDEVIELIVVPNGCTDDTAKVSRATLEELAKQTAHPSLRWQVCEVEQAGKSNAWNLYVHQFSDPNADYLLLMDADIEFLEPDTLRHMIEALEVTPQAWVSIDKPVKDVALKKNKKLMDQLSVAVSASSQEKELAICGQLYCGRAAVLRSIWMPAGLPVEDGFLRAMILTDRFTSPEVFERIVLAKSASHVFEAYTNLNRLLRHERWLVVSTTINSFIYSYLWANCNPQQDAGSLIEYHNDTDPFWVRQLIQKAISEKGWWVIPKPLLFRRFTRLQHQPLLKVVLRLPVAAIAFLADLFVFFQANLMLHRGEGLGYWGKYQGKTKL